MNTVEHLSDPRQDNEAIAVPSWHGPALTRDYSPPLAPSNMGVE